MRDDIEITGIENIVFGVEDMASARRFLDIYGLSEVHCDDGVSRWEALDGTGVELRMKDDPSLPPALIEGPTGRRYIWGVKSANALDLIGEELSRDRAVDRDEAGNLNVFDDDGHALTFRVTQRYAFDADLPRANVCGFEPQRPFNQRADFETPAKARAMGHVVYWSRDPARSISFYRDRLGFRVTDEVKGNAGVFARAKAHRDHHSVFFLGIGRAPFEPSFQHLEFAFADMQEILINGSRLDQAGYRTAFGPGRHMLGSNWYWYFLTPMGGAFELAADMDAADDDWTPGLWESMEQVKGWSMSFGAAGPSIALESERRR